MKTLIKKDAHKVGVRATKNNTFCLLFIILVQVCILSSARAQNLSPVKVIYTYESVKANGKPMTYKFYYIVRELQKEIDGRKYNQFTLSQDSTVVNGYVRYDTDTNQIKYFNSYDVDSSKNHYRVKSEKTLFSFGSSTWSCYSIWALGGAFTITTKRNSTNDTIYMKIISTSLGSDTSYVEDLVFDNRLYPCSIVVADTNLNRSINVNARVLSAPTAVLSIR